MAASPPPPEDLSPEEIERRFTSLTSNLNAPPGPRDYAVDDTVDLHFTPTDPEPIPVHRPWLVLSWILIVVAVLGSLLLLIVAPDSPTLWWAVLVITGLVGVVISIRQLPRHRHRDDDGAVI